MQHNVTCRIPFLLLLILFGHSAGAESIRVHFPLQGYFRPGKLMPIIIDSPGHAQSLRISGENVVPVNVPAQWSGVVPVLILAASSSPALVVEDSAENTQQFPLIPLE